MLIIQSQGVAAFILQGVGIDLEHLILSPSDGGLSARTAAVVFVAVFGRTPILEGVDGKLVNEPPDVAGVLLK